MGRDFRFYGERPVHDSKLILKVDDLINIATGSKDKNVVDLKMLQFILYTLAGHVNILEQMVELRIPKSGELLTMEDEYDDDIKRSGGVQKSSEEDKKRVTRGKQDIASRLDKYTDRERTIGKDDDYGRGRARRAEGKERHGRDVDKYGVDKERIRKMSDSDVEYEKEARGRSYDEGHRKKFSTHRGTSKYRGYYDEDSDEDEGKNGKDEDERGRGRVRKRTRSLDTEIPGRGRRRSRDESLDKNDQRHGSLGRTERQGIPIKQTTEEKNKKKDVGSFLVQVKQKHISPGRDGRIRGETGRVKGDKSGKHRQYDADSFGGSGSDDKYQEGSGRTEKKCDTGKNDDDEEQLKKLREIESLEAGGLWKCTGRENQGSFEEIEGTLVADSKGNMKFVPLDDGKKKGKGHRDKRSHKDKGKDDRARSDRDVRGKDYDRYGKKRDYRHNKSDDGRGGIAGVRNRWDDRDTERRDDRDDWDGDRDRDGRKGGRDGRRGKEYDRDDREFTDRADDGRTGRDRDRERRGGREGKYDRKRGREDRDGRRGVDRDSEEHSGDEEDGRRVNRSKYRVREDTSGKLGDRKGSKRGIRGSVKGGKGRREGGGEIDENEYGRRKRKGYESDEGDGGDDYDDEDDTGGRGGAGKGAGRGKAGDKGAASQKGRDASLTSVATGARIGKVGRDGSMPRVGSIEVVTRKQFHDLEKAVEELQKKAGPMAQPIMPGSKQLLKDISMGNASLTDVIQALQLQARLQAAERAIDRLADLIAQLAAAGVLTPEMLAKVAAIHSEVEQGYKEVPLGPGGKAEQAKLLQKLIAEGLDPAGISAALGTLGTTGTSGTAATDRAGRAGGAAAGAAGTGRGVFVPQSTAARPSSAGVERLGKLPRVTGSTLSAGIHSMRSGKSLVSKDCVTAAELEEAMRALYEDFLNNLGNITERVNATAEAAAGVANAADTKLTTALTMNARVSTLHGLVKDYTDQLHGFDAGVQMQLQSFQQQLNCIKGDLQEGLHELHYITHSTDTPAVVELREQYQVSANGLDDTRNSHKKLLATQDFLTAEIKDLAQCIEEFNDQKADRDEVIDGLRDKADANRLGGLLTLGDFRRLYEELGMRMQMCYDKFRAQDAVWMTAVQEVDEVISAKASATQLDRVQEDAREQFKELHRKAELVKRVLADPKVAVLTRKLTKGPISAARAQAALKEMSDIDKVSPPRPPAVRPCPTGANDVCLKEVAPPMSELTPFEDETFRDHICKRWCGGSHTLLSSTVTRENAAPYMPRDTEHTRRYMGVGTDNKLYNLVDQCKPCEECNAVEKIPGETEETSPHPGAGDQGDGPTVVTGREARRVTIIADADIQLMRDGLARKRRGLERKRSSGGIKRPLEEVQDIHECHEDVIPTKDIDIGVIVNGHITVLSDDAPGRQQHERTRRSNLAQERIREQFEAPTPHSTDADFISQAIAALSEL